MSEGACARRRPSNALDRRPLRFWEPFNIWWRAELEKTGKRATSDDIARWYAAQSGHAWGAEKPSLQETRTHAKCLRSVSSVRDYFREYRAKKKHEQSEMDIDAEEEDCRRSKGGRRGAGTRCTAATSNSTAAYSDVSGAMHSYMAYSNEEGYWGSGYLEGAASGMTTAAGAAAAAAGAESHAAALRAMSEYGQHMPGFDMACVHPGAYEAAWADYQQAAVTAAMSKPVTTQGPTLPRTQAMQQASQVSEQQQEQTGATEGTAGAATHDPSPFWQQQAGTERQGNGQQQSQQQGQLGVQPSHLPSTGIQTRAGRLSMKLLSPGLQLLANSLAFQMEMPSISPRMPYAPAMAGVSTDMGTSDAAGELYMLQEGSAAQAASAVKAEQGQQQAATVPMWDLPEQQYGAHANQGYLLSAAAGFGGFAAKVNTVQQAQQQQQQVPGRPPAPSRFPQQGPTATDREGCAGASAVHVGSPAALRGVSTQPAADAPAAAPQAANKHLPLDHPSAPAQAPSVCDTLHAVIPASLLAAVPLPPAMPGCPGHSTVDSILRQLEAGGRTPHGLLGPLAEPGSAGHPFARVSLSNILDVQGLMCHGAAAARHASQCFEHMPLPHQRLSLYAMGSGMLDMLSEGLDLDAFLSASDLVGAAAGAAGGDTTAPIAPSSRASLRWLRASQMQVPEHWQQHLQTLQEAPLRGGMGPSAAPPQAPFCARRASSTGIDALAEAAAAALAAHPELMQERGATATSTQQAEGAEASQGAAAGSGAGRLPCRKRAREQLAPKAEMGPPGSSYKRPCTGAGLGLNLGGDQQEAEGGKCQGFKYILDLATPRPQPAQQQFKAQPQPEQPGPGQQEVQVTEPAGADADAPAASAAPAEAAAPADAQPDASALQKHPVVLDLRPEELGATSENSLVTPQCGAARPGAKPSAQQPQQAEGETAPEPEQKAAGAAAHVQLGPRKIEGLMIAPLRSPVGGGIGMSTKGGLHCGPATAASTTGAPPVGPNGAVLPAPAMTHVAMAAAADVRPHVQAGVAPDATKRPSDPAKRLLPAMDEIERMI